MLALEDMKVDRDMQEFLSTFMVLLLLWLRTCRSLRLYRRSRFIEFVLAVCEAVWGCYSFLLGVSHVGLIQDPD